MKKKIIVLLAIVVFLVPQLTFAKSKMDLAKDYITIDEKGQALRLISEAILADPLNASIHFKAGQLYFQLNNISGSNKALDNACRLDHSFCPKVSAHYKYFGFYNLDAGGRSRSAINNFRKAIQYDPRAKDEIINKLFNNGENYLSNPDLSYADSCFITLNSLDRSYGRKIANIYIQRSSKVKAKAELFLLKQAVNFDDSRKKEVGHLLAKLAKDDKYTENEKSAFKNYASNYLSKNEMLVHFPPDFRELKVGELYKTDPLRKNEADKLWIRGPQGIKTTMYGVAKHGKIKLITRAGDEYYISDGETLPEGNCDLKIIGLTDGVIGKILFK